MAAAPSINYRLTIYDSAGNSAPTVITLSQGTGLFQNFDVSWANLLALGYVTAGMVAPVTRVKLEVQNVPGIPLTHATAEAWWGLVTC